MKFKHYSKYLIAPLIFFSSPLFSTTSKFPKIIDFGQIKMFQQTLIDDEVNSWTWQLGDSAFELGYCSFNDAPEIGTFIALLQKNHQLDVAVETGIFFGATTMFFSSCFEQVYTIDAYEDFYLKAKERLSHRSNIECFFGSSEKVLSELLPSLQEKRALFYLDAHGWVDGNYWPLLDELEAISKTHKDNCIVVIDDFKVPGTNINGITDGVNELSHEFIQQKLNKIFTSYTFHYLIPKQRSRSAKFVAIPRTWKNE